MNQGISLIVYPVKDLDAAKTLFGTFLGVKPYADSSYYVGYRVGDQEVGLDPNATSAGPITYHEVTDIKASLQFGLCSVGTPEINGASNEPYQGHHRESKLDCYRSAIIANPPAASILLTTSNSGAGLPSWSAMTSYGFRVSFGMK